MRGPGRIGPLKRSQARKGEDGQSERLSRRSEAAEGPANAFPCPERPLELFSDPSPARRARRTFFQRLLRPGEAAETSFKPLSSPERPPKLSSTPSPVRRSRRNFFQRPLRPGKAVLLPIDPSDRLRNPPIRAFSRPFSPGFAQALSHRLRTEEICDESLTNRRPTPGSAKKRPGHPPRPHSRMTARSG